MKSAPLFESPRPKVLSVRQPWAWLIVAGFKLIENRTWTTHYRGPLLIHAGVHIHAMPIEKIEQHFGVPVDRAKLAFGAIVGRADLVDIVARSDSPWFSGPYGWVLENPKLITPIPLRGKQMLFDLPADLNV